MIKQRGEAKLLKETALISANLENLKTKLSIVIAGDLNRFDKDATQFEQQVNVYRLVEAVPTIIVVPGYGEIKNSKDIG